MIVSQFEIKEIFMHILFLVIAIPVLLLLASFALVSLMFVGALMLEFPVLIPLVVAFAWLVKDISRRSVDKYAVCEQV